MNHIHVCLVSDQTIPNILGIYHHKPDSVLFITTEDMERKKKTEAILKTCERLNLKFEHSVIKVKEDSILDCTRKIDQWVSGKEDANFIVNLTCGTKIMSIAVYEYFKDFSTLMYYIPVPKNEFITPFPIKKPNQPQMLSLRLGVVEYLMAYGLEVLNIERIEHYKKEASDRKEITQYIVENYDRVKNLLVLLSGKLRSHRSDKELFMKEKFHDATNEEEILLKKLNFDIDLETISKNLSRSEIRYLTGGWLEEYSYNVISNIGKGIDDVVLDIKIRNSQGNENEFDVMFTKDNALYFIECKSLDQHDDKDLNALYKVGALQRDFGLRVKSFFLTTSPHVLKNGEIRPSIKARAEQLNTEVIPNFDVKNLSAIIKRKLNIT